MRSSCATNRAAIARRCALNRSVVGRDASPGVAKVVSDLLYRMQPCDRCRMLATAGPIEDAMWCMRMRDAMVGAALSSHEAILSAGRVVRLAKAMQ